MIEARIQSSESSAAPRRESVSRAGVRPAGRVRGTWNYRLGFVIDLLATPALVLFGIDGFAGPVVAALGLLAFGAFACSWLEYAVHRWCCHGRGGIAARVHARHHARVDDPVAFPAVLPLLICGALGLPWIPVLGVHAAALFVGGLEGGFLYYEVVHHVLHRARTSKRGRVGALAVRHARHHARPGGNFGTTSGLWDRVYRTEHGVGRSRAADAAVRADRRRCLHDLGNDAVGGRTSEIRSSEGCHGNRG